jgi:pyruvate/2-oxoglutarate dehydrogenase complex dihydrolipoamide dehydrogenase (E3) component
VLEVEAVLAAAGWPGNADSLNLGAAGVASERGYVIVDDHLQTSAPHIFAAGDINGRMMLVQSASYEARIAAENAILGVGQPNRHQVVPQGGFTDPEYASVGLTEEQARAAEGGCRGMAAGMWVEQLAELELAYPTYTAIVGLAARHLVRELGVMPLAAQ